MYQKWVDGTKISQLQQETDLSKDAIYKRFGRLRKENTQDDNVTSNQDTEIAMADIEIEYVDKDITNEDLNDYDNNSFEEEIDTETNGYNYELMPTTNQTKDPIKTDFVSGLTVAYIAIAVVSLVAVIFWWPQISDELKTVASKIRNKITDTAEEQYTLPQKDGSIYYPQY